MTSKIGPDPTVKLYLKCRLGRERSGTRVGDLANAIPFKCPFFFILSELFFTVVDDADPLSSSHQCFPGYAWRLNMVMEMPFQVTYSPLKNCSPLWDSSNFVVFLMTLKFAPPLSSSIVFLASCSFSSIAAICSAKSN